MTNEFDKINVLGVDVYCKDITARNTPYADVQLLGADASGNTDCTAIVQNAVNSEAQVIIFRPGRYSLQSIKIPSNKTIIGLNAQLVALSNNIFINASDGTTGGHSANKNITIQGFDVSPGQIVNCSEFAFAHATNINILDCSFHDNTAWHMIEFNSCLNCTVQRCHFSNYTGNGATEMLQLDIASSEMVFPWFGPYDSATCEGINIIDCDFNNSASALNTATTPCAIGNHNINGKVRNVKIRGCNFIHMNNCLKFVNLYDSVISDNTATDVVNFMQCSDLFQGNTISDNVLVGDFAGNADSKPGDGTLARGINITNVNGFSQKNVISGNDISRFRAAGMSVNGSNCVIRNNEVHHNGWMGIYAGYNSYKNQYTNNTLYGNNTSTDSVGQSRLADIYVYMTATQNVSGGHVIADNRMERMLIAGEAGTEESSVCGNVIENYPTSSTNLPYNVRFFNNACEYNNSPGASIQSATSVALTANAWTELGSVSIVEPGTYLVVGTVGLKTASNKIDATIDIFGTSHQVRSSVNSTLSTASANVCDLIWLNAGVYTLRVYSAYATSTLMHRLAIKKLPVTPF